MGLTMRERKSVSREYAVRYKRSDKKGKSAILDEFVKLTGYRRDYASFLLSHWGKRVCFPSKRIVCVGDFVSHAKRSGRKKKYGMEEYRVLYRFWELLNNPCGKRLKVQIPDLVRKTRQFNEFEIPSGVVSKLSQISPATIDRLFKADRKKNRLKSRSKTRPGSLLKKDIPIRTGVEWNEDEVGYLEIDLVGHDGGNARGEFCYTLNSIDIKSGWNDFVAIKNKAQIWTFEAMMEIERRLPFPLKGIDSDNGSEFINFHFVDYCKKEGIVFTRSRPSRKNDNCHVEEKNYSTVRTYADYCRYDNDEQRKVLNELYSHLRLYINFFQPRMKLKHKERIKSKIIKRYEEPKTPFKRLLELKEIDDETKRELKDTYQKLNPFELKRSINKIQEKLFRMAYWKKRGIS